MGFYIKGVEMTVFELQSWDIRRGADGKWYMVDTNAETSDGEWHEIVPVPPRGRLIDADALMGRIEHDTPLSSTFEKVVRRYIKDAPTIIPAEEDET